MRPVRLPPCAAGASPITSSARSRVAKTRNGPAPVFLIGKASDFFTGDVLAPRDEPRAKTTGYDLILQTGYGAGFVVALFDWGINRCHFQSMPTASNRVEPMFFKLCVVGAERQRKSPGL